jgi:hypothetical protein
MMFSRALPLVVTLFVPQQLDAGIIRVGPTGDFPEIAPAIAAAADGDVILVDPVGKYRRFDLQKGVAVCSAVSGRHFVVDLDGEGDWTANVLVADTRPDQKAAICGMDLETTWLPYSGELGWLQVSRCKGEVLLEDITLACFGTHDVVSKRLFIEDSSNVSLAGMRIFDIRTSIVRGGIVTIRRSNARVEGCVIGAGETCESAVNALEVEDSLLVISSSDVYGGKSGPQSYWPWCDPTKGGDAIVATRSDVMILGTSASQIRGGDGGSMSGWPGLDGGVGFRGDRAVVSLVTVAGGHGGDGSPPGHDGKAWDGQLTRQDVMPRLRAPIDLHVGDTFPLVLATEEPGQAILLASTESGFLVDHTKIGPRSPRCRADGSVCCRSAWLALMPPWRWISPCRTNRSWWAPGCICRCRSSVRPRATTPTR